MSDPLPEHDEAQVNYLRTMLTAWSRYNGNNGVLFDGGTTFQLGQKIDHFELGIISDDKKALKAAVGFFAFKLCAASHRSASQGVSETQDHRRGIEVSEYSKWQRNARGGLCPNA